MTDNEKQTAERLASIETDIKQIGTVLKELVQDHENRIRYLEHENARQAGVLKLIGWLGAPATAAVIFFLAKVQ